MIHNAIIISLLISVLLVTGCQEQVEAPKTEVLEDSIRVDPLPEFKEELSNILELASVQSILSYIEENDSQTLADLIELNEIEAPPFKEELRAMAFREKLAEAGVDSVWIDEAGNVFSLRYGNSEKTVALAAHLDTVFPEGTDVKVKQRGDTLFAPGIVDNARGLAIILAVLRAMDQYDVETSSNILFIGNVGEEGIGDLRGVKHIFRDGGPQIDSFIAFDGNIIDIISRGLGSHRYRVTYQGSGGHSWGAFGLANPHHALGAAIRTFAVKADDYTKSGLKTSYNVGRIGGGTSVNSIPFESWMEVDMRSVSPENLNEIDTIFQRAVREGLEEQNKLLRYGQPLTVEVAMIGNRPSGSNSNESPLVQRALAVADKMGKRTILRTGSTDANIPISLGIPAVTIGEGVNGGGYHSLEEFFITKDGYKSVQETFLLLIVEAGINNPSTSTR